MGSCGCAEGGRGEAALDGVPMLRGGVACGATPGDDVAARD